MRSKEKKMCKKKMRAKYDSLCYDKNRKKRTKLFLKNKSMGQNDYAERCVAAYTIVLYKTQEAKCGELTTPHSLFFCAHKKR